MFMVERGALLWGGVPLQVGSQEAEGAEGFLWTTVLEAELKVPV